MRNNSGGVIQRADIGQLLSVLTEKGYITIGPTLRDNTIVYDEIESVQDLPIGWTDIQAPGSYRLIKRDDEALFAYNTAPQSWKRYLNPPRIRLWKAQRTEGGGFTVDPEDYAPSKYAFIGVRACELKAILIQDKVFLGGYKDPCYQSRREGAFIVAVNCTQANETCFCASMNSGPKAESDYDLALTEIIDEQRHEFVVECGSERGEEILKELQHRPVEAEDSQRVDERIQETISQMGRSMDTHRLQSLLASQPNHPRWEEVAERCLSCANCTMACPTCFCSTVEDVTDLTGDHAERWRQWDSCFTMDFTYISGGHVRSSVMSRYRQWMTHKLSTWHDQFGVSGCVGCGRCITWCPVGIDITEEVAAFQNSHSQKTTNSVEK
ncbi:4Fe-4S dicluster domain-containing protein [Pelagicoccus mobilis]|uniref:4Fe-4S dicluster domain-containing protein n=1 Tax=Pelagicoccus mobilis TaxID=415221 RepID=A0A934RTS1_9BACT|nr:4Fe-4S dicluster domain-containing protein [Pelagicoccus mobilis]MBK1876236.1 4Fe-4S dicluster domain-containing protein [Pelagicoccus mobilis]